MKHSKVVVALMLTATMALSAVGCGKGAGGNGAGSQHNGGEEVKIKVWASGGGVDWLEAEIDAFNEKQSDWYVTYEASAAVSSVMAGYGDEEIDETDLYMSQLIYDTTYMEPLEDILEDTADGDTKPLKEKFEAAYLDIEELDGHYYSLTYGGGTVGIIYNKEMFDKAGITQLPRTTDELATVCDTLLNNDITPLIHFKQGGYWSYIQDVWQSQYDGLDYYYNNFYGAMDGSGNSPSKEVLMRKDGRYQVLKALEKIVTTDNVVAGSNSNDHVTSQTLLLNPVNEDIAMMVNGTWFSSEMEGKGVIDKFSVMRTPVISSITDKLTTVKGDIVLRDLISAIDAVTDGEAQLSDYASGDGYNVNGTQISKADWEYVQAARNSIAINFPGMSSFIPTYSAEKEGAKEFLKFFYSDAGYKIYLEYTHNVLPITLCEGAVDTGNWNSFATEVYDMKERSEHYIVSTYSRVMHKIFPSGGARAFADYDIIGRLSASNSSDRKSADEIWNIVVDTIDLKYDKVWSGNIQ